MGLSILTGVVRKPVLRMYWETDEMTSTPYFNTIMSRDRFDRISRYLHFSNNEDIPAETEDRLIKLRPVIDYLTAKFKEM